MRTNKRFGFLLIQCIFAMALLAIGLFSEPVFAQVTPTTGGTITTTNPLAGSTTYNINSAALLVHKDRGLGVLASLTPAAATNQVTLNFQVSNDATNWAAATPFSLTANLTAATTNYIVFTNFPATGFNNVTYWRLGTFVAANTNAITNTITWSVHQ